MVGPCGGWYLLHRKPGQTRNSGHRSYDEYTGTVGSGSFTQRKYHLS